MKWKINYSRDAEKFIERENIRGETREELSKFIKRTKDKDINVDVKKLKGSWAGYYRIRKGKIRIVFDVDYKNLQGGKCNEIQSHFATVRGRLCRVSAWIARLSFPRGY
jgi:mRNA interferase RelE/StbE